MIVGGLFDGNLAVAALPPVIAAALAAACVVVMSGAAAVALSGRRARRRRTGRAVMVDFTGQRLTSYCWDAEGDFYEPALTEREHGRADKRTAEALQEAVTAAKGLHADRERPMPHSPGKPIPFARSVSAEERLWADIQAVGEPGGLQRVVDGLNEAS